VPQEDRRRSKPDVLLEDGTLNASPEKVRDTKFHEPWRSGELTHRRSRKLDHRFAACGGDGVAIGCASKPADGELCAAGMGRAWPGMVPRRS